MTARKILLEPGTWYAGYHDVPFFISDAMIQSVLSKYGLTEFAFHDRDELVPPVDPKVDPKYREGWEAWLTAKYSGKPQTIEIPAYSDHVDWLLVRPTFTVKPTPAPASEAPEVAKPGWWLLIAMTGAYYWLRKRKRR